MKVGYGKIGRSMPLTLSKCGNLGGDVEMAAVVKTLALRHPEHEFWLIGRNTNERPEDVGLPPNVVNPWVEWAPKMREAKKDAGLNKANLSVEEHLKVRDLYDRFTLDTIVGMDQIVLWAGQHGTTNTPLPTVKDPGVLTKPHDWSAYYVSFLIRGVNHWRDANPVEREEVWLNSDPRNYLKLRDTKWPQRYPVLAQHTYEHRIKHARYGDPFGPQHYSQWNLGDAVQIGAETWQSTVRNVYARLEVNGLVPGTPFGDLVSFSRRWEDRQHFGLFINETRRYVRENVARINVLRDWVLPLEPAWIHGTWSATSLAELQRDIRPAPWDQYFERLHSVRCTFTTPASGTGWATAKPWEAFAAGTVCFFHPEYDTQDNVLGDAPPELREWLRVDSPEQLRKKVEYLNGPDGRYAWDWLVSTQRAHFDIAVRELRYAKMIEKRLGVSA